VASTHPSPITNNSYALKEVQAILVFESARTVVGSERDGFAGSVPGKHEVRHEQLQCVGRLHGASELEQLKERVLCSSASVATVFLKAS
jgi:hypothetical protein